jgi:hypothetical protein
MKKKENDSTFFGDDHAVLGLPLRVTVSLIIGMAALGAILSYILNPCLFPERLIVTVSPMVITISDGNTTDASFLVHVSDTKSHPVTDARVIIKGMGEGCCGFTDENGSTTLTLQVHLDPGIHEGYLDLSVSAACHEPFEQMDFIKIVKIS